MVSEPQALGQCWAFPPDVEHVSTPQKGGVVEFLPCRGAWRGWSAPLCGSGDPPSRASPLYEGDSPRRPHTFCGVGHHQKQRGGDPTPSIEGVVASKGFFCVAFFSFQNTLNLPNKFPVKKKTIFSFKNQKTLFENKTQKSYSNRLKVFVEKAPLKFLLFDSFFAILVCYAETGI
jgi:hypothetical protein